MSYADYLVGIRTIHHVIPRIQTSETCQIFFRGHLKGCLFNLAVKDDGNCTIIQFSTNGEEDYGHIDEK